jgi:hypothetical protein
MSRFRALILAGVLIASVGCAGKADVSGSVSYQGRPVRIGSVQAVGPDGMSVSGLIRPDGSYTIVGVRAGRVRFAIHSLDPFPPVPPDDHVLAREEAKVLRTPPKGKGLPRRDLKTLREEAAVARELWFELPKETSDLDASGLTAELKTGLILLIWISNSTAISDVDNQFPVAVKKSRCFIPVQANGLGRRRVTVHPIP